MKLLFSSAVFVAILASASSIEDRAAVKGQHLAPRDVHTSTSWLLKQIAENIAVKKGGEDGDESETDDEPKTEDKPKTDDEPEEPKTDDEPEEPKTDDQPESDDQPEADDEPEEEPVKEDDDETDDKNKEDDDDDDKKSKDDDDDDDDKKSKDDDDDDDDKKNKDDDDDDDDDKNTRTIILPECVVGGKNYLRCDPFTVKKNDIDTCDAIYDVVCSKDAHEGSQMSSTFEESYCECIGLEYEKIIVQLRGAVNTRL